MKQCTCYALRAVDCTCKPAKYGELYTSPTAKQEQGEPVACFDWLPEGATHLTQIKVNIKSGGRLEMRAHVFKYDNEVLMVYATDNDNEYPEWREAKECFFHLNFPVFSVPAPPAAQPAPQQRAQLPESPL
jgi:hypothetical protein